MTSLLKLQITVSAPAYDDAGKLVAVYTATMGSQHDPLPLGNWKILGIDKNPKFHYNPALFWDAKPGAEKAARAAMEHGLRRVEVQVKGPGSGRDTAVRSIQGTGIEVTSIKDVTPVPHNGCRQPKRRRT